MSDTKKLPDEMVLFPEATVEGLDVKIRPWTFGDLLDINPHLENIFTKLEEKNILLDFTMIGLKEIKELYFAAAPQLLKIIEISTKKTEEEIRALDLSTAVKILYVIWGQNRDNLKNAFALLGLTAAEEIKEKEESSSESEKVEVSA